MAIGHITVFRDRHTALGVSEMEKIVTYDSGEFRIYFPYDPALINGLRSVPNRSFNKGRRGQSYWSASYAVANSPALANFAAANQFAVDAVAAAKLEELAAARVIKDAELSTVPQITAGKVAGEISVLYIATREYDPEQNAVIKSAGARWNAASKHWVVPFGQSAAMAVEKLVTEYGMTIDPALVDEINARLAALDAFITKSGLHDCDLEIPAPAGLAYLGYQKAGIAYASEKGNVLIGDEPGLGKTIQAIGISNMASDMRRILVVCPASLKLNWKREWEKWCVKGLGVGIVTGGKAAQWPTDAGVVIINFDLVAKHLPRLHAAEWDMLVVDEAHNLRNAKAKRTTNILGCKGRDGSYDVEPIPAKRLVLMTGTPIVNRPVELWPLISAVNPAKFDNFFSYGKRYCGASNNGYGWDFSGATNLEELQSELRAHCMVRRTKADVLKELPAKTRQIIRLDDPALVAAEQKGLAEIRHQLSDLEAAKILAFLKKDRLAYHEAAKQLKDARSAAFYEMSKLRHQTARAKVPYVVEMVKDALDQGKVIIFAHHHDVIDAYKDAFGDAAVVIEGGTPNEHRQAAVDRFQNDPSCTVIVASILAAGVGLTLTASSHVIFGELDWVPGNMCQAEDRAHRIGQKDNVLVWHIVVDGSLDARMVEVLVQKQAVIDGAMDAEITTKHVSISCDTPDAAEDDNAVSEIALPSFQIIGHDEVTVWLAHADAREETNKLSATAKRAKERAVNRGFTAEAEKMSDREIKAVHDNLIALAVVCDGAKEKDGMGYSGTDAKVGRALSYQDKLDPLQAAYARSMLRKYFRQLGISAVNAMYDNQKKWMVA
jgi:hypothetical protein